MKCYKKFSFIFVLFILLSNMNTIAQNNLGRANDFERIILSTYIPNDQLNEIPKAARRSLKNRLNQIATRYGMGGGNGTSRFIITAQVIVLDKEIIPAAPAKFMYNLELNLYIGDVKTGELYASEIFTLKGVGTTETKAYISAFKTLPYRNNILADFMNTGKEKIIRYYNSNCDLIIKKAMALSQQEQYDKAISLLHEIPSICKECFEKAMDVVIPIYQEKIDNECNIIIARARNIWNSEPSIEGAKKVMNTLFLISPKSKCFKEAFLLSEKIGEEVKILNHRYYQLFLEDRKQKWEISKQKWEMSKQNSLQKFALRKARIEASRAIGTAYAGNEYRGVDKVIKAWFN